MIGLPSYFAACAEGGGLLGLPRWWKYLDAESTANGCNINFHVPGDIWLVALAIIDILLRIAGIAAVLMIVYAGIKYMSSMGNADQAASARKLIINTFIGLIIVSIAAALVAFIGDKFGGSVT